MKLSAAEESKFYYLSIVGTTSFLRFRQVGTLSVPYLTFTYVIT